MQEGRRVFVQEDGKGGLGVGEQVSMETRASH